MKSILGNPVVQFLLGRLIGSYMLFVGVTTRWQKVNRAAVEPFMTPGAGRLILCIWHGRFPLIHTMWSFKPPGNPGAGGPRSLRISVRSSATPSPSLSMSRVKCGMFIT